MFATVQADVAGHGKSPLEEAGSPGASHELAKLAAEITDDLAELAELAEDLAEIAEQAVRAARVGARKGH